MVRRVRLSSKIINFHLREHYNRKKSPAKGDSKKFLRFEARKRVLRAVLRGILRNPIYRILYRAVMRLFWQVQNLGVILELRFTKSHIQDFVNSLPVERFF